MLIERWKPEQAGVRGAGAKAVLTGERVALRARRDSDVLLLHAGLYDDVATHVQADGRAWRPIPQGSPASPYAPADPSPEVAHFTVILLGRPAPDEPPLDGASRDDDDVVGEALLWGIDLHNRSAHLGISLLPTYRGRGLGSDVVRVLRRYGFDLLGLHRLQIDTLTTNTAMQAVAVRTGFVHEGTRQDAAWVDGQFVDELVYGLTSGR